MQVLIVSENPSLTGVLATLLGRREELRYAGAVRTVDEARFRAELDPPDVVIACAPPADGRDVLTWRSLREQGARILMLTTYLGRGQDVLALLAGASALVLIPEHRLLDVITSVAAGDVVLSRELSERVEALTSGEMPVDLTDEELGMLELVARGTTDSVIAAELDLTHEAVQASVLGLAEKLR